VSIDAIATAAGTSRNSIYRCFGTKRRLYLAAMGALGAKLSEGQAEPAAGTPSQQLATRLTRYFDVIQKYQPGYAALETTVHSWSPGCSWPDSNGRPPAGPPVPRSSGCWRPSSASC
jgi:AcrR family transcriptional regulator